MVRGRGAFGLPRGAVGDSGRLAAPAVKPVLAVDLGGTKMLVALVASRDVIASERFAMARELGPEAWLDAIATHAADWRGRYAAAAVAVTGLVRTGAGICSIRPFSIRAGFPLVAALAHRLDVTVAAMNDAQAAAWGEYRYGAGRDSDMVFLTVSTGIGGGIVLGGRLLAGRSGICGHAGQMLVGLDGESKRIEDAAWGLALRREALASAMTSTRAIFLEPKPANSGRNSSSTGRPPGSPSGFARSRRSSTPPVSWSAAASASCQVISTASRPPRRAPDDFIPRCGAAALGANMPSHRRRRFVVPAVLQSQRVRRR